MRVGAFVRLSAVLLSTGALAAAPPQGGGVWGGLQRAAARAVDGARSAKDAMGAVADRLVEHTDPRVVAYFAAKKSAELASAHRPWRRLSAPLMRRLAPLFPRLDLTAVRFRDEARTPATGWRHGHASMAFGSELYFGPAMPQLVLDRFARGEARAGESLFRLLVHELVHADQVRRTGSEAAFARLYLDEWVIGGLRYEDNRLEREAFAAQRGPLPPPIVAPRRRWCRWA